MFRSFVYSWYLSTILNAEGKIAGFVAKHGSIDHFACCVRCCRLVHYHISMNF